MKRWERRERIQKKRGMSELLTPRMGSVDEKDTRWKREWKGKIKTEPGTRIASRLSLVRPMRFERTTFRVGVWHSIQLSYGRVSLGDLYIITERLAKVKSEKRKIFRKGRGASEGRKVLKKGKEKNFEKMLFFSKKGVDKTGRAWYYKWAVTETSSWELRWVNQKGFENKNLKNLLTNWKQHAIINKLFREGQQAEQDSAKDLENWTTWS